MVKRTARVTRTVRRQISHDCCGCHFGELAISRSNELTRIVRVADEDACREFTKRIAPMDFVRSRKKFWVRAHRFHVDFLHLHRCGISYGAPYGSQVDYRIHSGLRVLNDPFEALALNGPSSDVATERKHRYHLRFNAKSRHMFDRCVTDLERFVSECAEPWFRKYLNPSELAANNEGPLKYESRDSLIAALSGNDDPARLAASFALLGIKSAELHFKAR